MDDPILQIATTSALIGIPVLSYLLGKVKFNHSYLRKILAMVISFPMFLFVVIVPDTEISKYFFYISMSLWTGGFFSIGINYFIYKKLKARQ